MRPSTENLWIFSLFVLICGTTWVRSVYEWIPKSCKNTCSDVHLFPLPFGSCCTPQKMKAIITVIVPRFWQPSLHSLFPPKRSVICFPLLMDFLYDSSFSFSLLLPPWMCVMSMWDFEGDGVWLLMWCAIATLNLWWRMYLCTCQLLFNSYLFNIVPRFGLDVCERFRPQRTGWTEDRTCGLWAPR